jgi:A/G-specific adenine glycosylase
MTSSHTNRKATPAPAGSKERRIRRALLRWYCAHARPLPWRNTRDAYRIWISETMLQQTQVATVIPYYTKFLRAFPSVQRLAHAELERVLELWSGLGYYRRARNLHVAAQRITARFGGYFPITEAEARSLPGVGAYTAAAVLSIANGVPLAALDGNVARVIARLDALAGSLAQPAFRRSIEDRLSTLLSRTKPGNFNQAMMELGQTVCLPGTPRCTVCPLRRDCRAHLTGRSRAFPSPRPRRSTEVHHLASALVLKRRIAAQHERSHRSPSATTRRQARALSRAHLATNSAEVALLLVRGLDDGLMSDMWNFPSAFGASPALARARLLAKLSKLCGNAAKIRLRPPLARLDHSVTYRKIRVCVYLVEGGAAPHSQARWMQLSEFDATAVSQLARKIALAVSAPLSGIPDAPAPGAAGPE